MEQDAGSKKQWTFTGWHMALVIFAFFGTIIAVNAGLAFFAFKSWTGLVVPNSYVASQNFNKKLVEVEAQRALQWKSRLTHMQGKLLLTMKGADGKPLSGLVIKATAKRPTHENEDVDLNFHDDGNGRYSPEHILAPGSWAIHMSATQIETKSYRQIFRLVVR